METVETITKNYPIYVLEENGVSFTLVQAPLGASASAQILDGLIACGCKKIISAGSCGVLVDIEENEFLIPKKALRDEGTSYKYLPAERYIELDAEMLKALQSFMTQHKIPYRECTTWTTDGFFRETADMIYYRKEEGCDCVEMECAALAACAKKRGAQFGQFFFTADSLANLDQYDERGWGKTRYRQHCRSVWISSRLYRKQKGLIARPFKNAWFFSSALRLLLMQEYACKRVYTVLLYADH